MGISEKLHQMDGGHVVLKSPSPLKPILTKSMEKKDDDEEEECSTPTRAESRICSKLTCPPAPKKRKPASSRCLYAGVREFFNPPDFETLFVRNLKGA
ncbi:hypothetical protein ACJIZ3_005173 [Penstemon smallii]|uniref:Uncharacterized protein n=1 Tax=Penstemon smallii TaxID=265156 RepID=A0ABD3S4H0_9LAMI